MRTSSLLLLGLVLSACAPDTETACGDGEDEDRDGLTDCADPDCADLDVCVDDADGDNYDELTGDCDDDDPAVNPAADEICDGIDNDCDGLIDDRDPGTEGQATWYRDADGDGWGLEDDTDQACDPGAGWAAQAGDCDDDDPAAYPGAAEVEAPEACMRDLDEDGWGDEFPETVGVEAGTDCDDAVASTNPAQTEAWYDGVDADCDGWNDYDQDHDGDRLEGGGGADCDDLDPEVNSYDDDGDGFDPCGGDCDDDDETIHPGVFELNDGVDNDCDGDIDWLSLGNAGARLAGEGDGDAAGSAVAGMDVDGDGLSDLLIGAPGSDTAGLDAGVVAIVTGPASGELLLDAPDIELRGESAGGLAGSAIAPAGDVDGDGVADLLVGAPMADYRGSGAGAAYLLLGPLETGSLADAARRFAGETIEDQAGTAVAGGGDADGDGRADVLIGAPYGESGGQGAAYLVLDAASSSASLGLERADLILRGIVPGDHAGQAVSLAGDANGDGLADLAVGAPDAGGSGAVYVVLGAAVPSGDLSAADSVLTGLNAGDEAGWSVAWVGDVDWDGHDDLLVGAPGAEGGAGAAYLLLGPFPASGGLDVAGASFVGVSAGDGAGSSVASAGTIDGDRYDDILIGVAAGSDASPVLARGPVWGSVSLAGADGVYVGEASGDHAGAAVAGAGDTDGDGFGDLLIGAPGFDGGATDGGAAYLIVGGPELSL
jgi:hypothetical protein